MDNLKAELIASILTEFILRLWMQTTSGTPLRPDTPINRHRYYSRVVNQALDIIDEKYADDLRVDQISAAIGTSNSNIRALLKKETGKSFTQHLQEARVEMAKELLYQGSENINTIANEVGYRSLPAFFRVFRRFTDMIPLEFAKTLGVPQLTPEKH